MIQDAGPQAQTTVYVGIPSANIALPGFSPVPVSELPREAILVIGDQSAFEENFQFPERR
jgi:hypothetical protein